MACDGSWLTILAKVGFVVGADGCKFMNAEVRTIEQFHSLCQWDHREHPNKSVLLFSTYDGRGLSWNDIYIIGTTVRGIRVHM